MKALVLRTAGTNCEDESVRALHLAGADASMARTDAAARDAERLADYGILVFAGGFSYGDDLGSGRVWGHELGASGLGAALRRHVDRGGVILGVCNGFQVLVESGLFEPDKAPEERTVALYANASNHYECRWVTLREHAGNCAWLVDGLEWPCPVAHGEGRFVVKDEAALARLRANGQVALTYVGAADGAATGTCASRATSSSQRAEKFRTQGLSANLARDPAHAARRAELAARCTTAAAQAG